MSSEVTDSTQIDDNDNSQLIESLCQSCRLGDLESVDQLLSLGAPVNYVDSFDNTPLYLASLCGHEAVVKLLLQRGAICDSDKYEGVRCIYGALTERIRRMLLSWDMRKGADENLPFAMHFRSLLGDGGLGSYDVVLTVGKQGNVLGSGKDTGVIRAHRFMLCARSNYFKDKFDEQWRYLEVVDLSKELDDELALRCIIDHVYLIHDPTKFAQVNKETLLRYAEWFELDEFKRQLQHYLTLTDAKKKAKFNSEFQVAVYNDSRIDFKSLVFENIIGKKLIIYYEGDYYSSDDSDDSEEELEKEITEAQIKHLQTTAAYPDLIIEVFDVEKNQTVNYPVHRSVLIRLEYFKVMFTSSFTESQYFLLNEKYQIVDRNQPIRIVNFPAESAVVAEIILKYIYFDHTDIPLHHAVDVLFAADLLMNQRLKTMAAITITKSENLLPEGYNLYDILRAGWETRVDRLEHHVARLISRDLDSFLSDPKFHDIVKESSERIQGRQETDTIELIDDIRFYLAKKWAIDHDGLFEGQKEEREFLENLPGYEAYQGELEKVELLLEELSLNA